MVFEVPDAVDPLALMMDRAEALKASEDKSTSPVMVLRGGSRWMK